MLEQKQINKIKETVEEFFEKMTMPISNVEVGMSPAINSDKESQEEENRDVVNLDVKSEEPQILIGQGGQTLFEIQRLLRNILSKRLEEIFYFNLDINGYKKQKTEYLRNVAKEAADSVSLNKEEKALIPMSSYERRIIHAELSGRSDVITESRGEGFDRHIVIKPK
jgi:spoIIIJ-associated protein